MKKITKKELEKHNIPINNKNKKENVKKTQIKKKKKTNTKTKEETIKKEINKVEKTSDTKNKTNSIKNPTEFFFKKHRLLSIFSPIVLIFFIVLMINYNYPKIKEKIEFKEIKEEIVSVLKDLPKNKYE